MATNRLYYTDSYLTEFTAVVLHQDDGGRRVYLDRTAFYPTSGGQPHDHGLLGGVPLLDVIDEGEQVAHLLARPHGQTEVRGVVDWPRRFDHMQQHTGQHLLSAVAAELLGAATVSVHFGAEASTLDLETGAISEGDVRRLEARANAVLAENRPVTVGFEDAATAGELRKASDRAGDLRIVTIAGLDRSACGGTHVRATGEIGAILIRRVERVKKRVRLEFFCGARAIGRARADYDLLAGVAAASSAGVDEVPAVVEKLRADLKARDTALRATEGELLRRRAVELHQAVPADPEGRRLVIERSASSSETLRGLAQAVIALPGAVFLGATAEPPTILYASAENTGVDAGAILKPLLAESGGRGGGSARMAQGTLPSRDALEAILRRLGG